jgi:hypothetical protein
MFMIGLVAGQVYMIVAAIVFIVIMCKIHKVSRHEFRAMANAIDTAVTVRDCEIHVLYRDKLVDVVKLRKR